MPRSPVENSRVPCEEILVRMFLIHRDPKFYALPTTSRAKNGHIRVTGFPSIGTLPRAWSPIHASSYDKDN